MSYAQVVFTGTINVGTISGLIITLLGIMIVYWRGKVADQKTRRIIREENEKTRQCIHSLPNHPENPKNQENPPIE